MAKIQLSDAEWKVMHAVWVLPAPVRVRDVLESVAPQTGWAYTTAKTLMERLVEKGALASQRTGVATEYRSLLPRGQAQRTALRDLLRKVFGATPGALGHALVDDDALTPADRRALLRKLRDLEKEDDQ